MKNIFTSFICVLFLITSKQALRAEFIQTNSMAFIADEVSKLKVKPDELLVIFDVDEVISVPSDQVLHPQYRTLSSTLVNEIIDRRTESLEAPDRYTMLWDIVTVFVSQGSKSLVDPSVLPLIHDLEKRGIRHIALTRCLTGTSGCIGSMEDWRIDGLNELGVDFSSSFGDLEKLELGGSTKPHFRPPMYYQGVVFTSAQDKGTVLASFLEKADYSPRCIVFIDDKKENLSSVAKYCAPHGIDYHGYHFTKAKEQELGPINEERARLQFSILEAEGRWISDAEADQRLQCAISECY